jgi:hypothetical protein
LDEVDSGILGQVIYFDELSSDSSSDEDSIDLKEDG